MLVFTNSKNISDLQYYFENKNYEVTFDINEKFDLSFITDTAGGGNISELINLFYKLRVKPIVFFSNEFHGQHLDLCRKVKDITNLIYMCPSILNEEMNFKAIFTGWWFSNTSKVYKNSNFDYKPYTKKDFKFEALLGNPNKKNRQFLLNEIIQNEYKILYNVGTDTKSDTFLIDEDVNYEHIGNTHSLTELIYNDISCYICQVIPKKVYLNSEISIIAETNSANPYFFPTEKITKPIIGKRPFICFAEQHFYKNLKSIGFKTFDSIIDESFDEIYDIDIRYSLAWQQLEKFNKMDTGAVKEICEYNYFHLMNTNWQNLARQTLHKALNI